MLTVWIMLVSSLVLRTGDLIFQESCPDHPDDTIKEVTESLDGYNFTHVGMVYIDEKDAVFVIEATIPVVVLTPLEKYILPDRKACPPISVVMRLKEEYKDLIPGAIEAAMSHLGKGYDYAFDLENDLWYCSELIYEAFRQANGGASIFPLNRMTFKAPSTGEFTEGWVRWFRELSIPIPEGEPGINPGAMSRSEVLQFIGVLSL
ncbi:MAG: hypothetical protein LUG98_00150 [Tannerellaceae bacterium]|nr:hypothetical protein [Tannerellaceae bacterium]